MSTGSPSGAVRICTVATLLLFLLPVSALGTRFGLWDFKVGLLLLTVSVLGSVVIEIANAIWFLRKPDAKTKRALRWASLAALPPVVVFATTLRNPGIGATLHNISTDTRNPPEFTAAAKIRGEHSNPLAYTEDIANVQRQAYPNLAPLRSPLLPEQAYQRALRTAVELGWEIYAKDPAKGHIEAVDTTFWFGFKDDIVIRIQPGESGGSRIDLRSVSRVGKGDLGANARRIRIFQERFQPK